MSTEFYTRIHCNPIIAAINDLKNLDLAIKSPSKIIFLLKGDIFNLKDIVEKAKKNDMAIYIHLDLMDGFSKDTVALKYINDRIKPNGIITTKSSMIKKAKELELFAIQRFFLLDSLSFDTGISSVEITKPDAVEILPGIMHKATKEISKRLKTPIITGGLIKDKEDVIMSLRSGAVAISTSNTEVWFM